MGRQARVANQDNKDGLVPLVKLDHKAHQVFLEQRVYLVRGVKEDSQVQWVKLEMVASKDRRE